MKYEAIANRKNVITLEQARFTLLSSQMVRLEWAEDGKFENRPSFAVVNRKCATVPFTKQEKGRELIIRTKHLTVSYKPNGRKLSRNNLSITFKVGKKKVTWFPGKKDSGNLGGTIRTLDETKGNRIHLRKPKRKWVDIDLGQGLLSKSGWVVVDDSDTIVLNKGWVSNRRPGQHQDIYFMGHGLDFKAALKDSANVFGRQPLPPRYAFGYWYSRYWAYTDKEIEEVVQNHDNASIPLDVMVIDMDWHLEGWTGYTWDKRYFPDPQDLLQWLREKGLKITLNLHPADGIGPHEEQFSAMAKALGHKDKNKAIPFDCTDPKFMKAYFELLHHPMEDDGVDFWWMDWQQGEETKLPGLDPLPWLNHLHWHDKAQRKEKQRPLCFSRYGGIGSGRYPVGFSGDTVIAWETLAYQPYFTSTAANVLYGYWSHDIGGHMPGSVPPELYLRWIQYGIYSPVLRTHTTKNPTSERRIHEFPAEYSSLMVKAVRERYEMVPYIYTECRKGMDSALSLCRPMYHEHPEEKAAYQTDGQYYFGDEIIVAPIVAPINKKNECATQKFWLPKGEWFDTAQGDMLKGGKWTTREYLLAETPAFVKAGAILPGQQTVNRLEPGCYKDLVITAYPGGNGNYTLYEDDGISNDYLTGASVTIPLKQSQRGGTRKIVIGPSEGFYERFKPNRTLELRLPGTVPPKDVQVGDRALRWSYRIERDGWTYDGANGMTIVKLRYLDITAETEIKIRFPKNYQNQAMGLKAKMARLERARVHTACASPWHVVSNHERDIVELAQTGNRMSRNPESFLQEIKKLKEGLKSLPKNMSKWKRAAQGEAKGFVQQATNIIKTID